MVVWWSKFNGQKHLWLNPLDVCQRPVTANALLTFATFVCKTYRFSSSSSSSMCRSGSEAMEAIRVSMTWLSELAVNKSWSWNRLNCTDQTLCVCVVRACEEGIQSAEPAMYQLVALL